VVVETLADRLGTTKGSFYWHFADRKALIAAALELWEREHTIEVIDHLREIPDPAERLRRLFELAFGGDVGGAISVALYANAPWPPTPPTLATSSSSEPPQPSPHRPRRAPLPAPSVRPARHPHPAKAEPTRRGS
jgi:AcrR family transcriptional regulator